MIMHHSIQIPLDGFALSGELTLVPDASALVIFTHGSGSSRFSPRNRLVADDLEQASVATLLFDLLTDQENLVLEHRFDLSLLTERLLAVTHWITAQPQLQNLRLGYFGASTGAAAALSSAAQLPKDIIHAIVSRSGRPDLVTPQELAKVTAPTLLIVGGNDHVVMQLNQLALEYISVPKQLKIVRGASHLFAEPGTMEKAARFTTKWFQRYLVAE